MNICEFVYDLLPKDRITLHLGELPQDATDDLLIEETGASGSIKSFVGYDGEIGSRVQLYAKTTPKSGAYARIDSILKDFYKIIQKAKGKEKDGIKILWVGEFNYAENMRDAKHNYVFSLDFPVIYKIKE